MAGPEEFTQQAQRIVGALLEPGQEAAEIEGAVAISDVEVHAFQFSEELEFANDIGLGVLPAMSIGGERIPVSLRYAFEAFYPRGWLPRARPSPLRYEFEYFLRDALQTDMQARAEQEVLPLEEARGVFLRRATNFLATRIAAVRNYEAGAPRMAYAPLLNIAKRRRGPRVSTPGCNFSVSTNSSGLRVFWSGAYWITPNYFSAPTTPVGSVLQSGTYIFGVDGGAYGSAIQWDRNAVLALPGPPHVHLNF